MATARLLPGARGQALLSGARAGLTLITGRPPRGRGGRLKATPAQGGRDRAPTNGAGPRAPDGRPKRSSATSGANEQLTDAIRHDIERAERALRRGDLRVAAGIAGRLAQELPANRRVLEVHAAALAGGDDVRAYAVALHRLHFLDDDPDVRRRERIAGGRVAILSPEWLPRLPGNAAPIRRPRKGVVLVLADKSLPYRSTPTTERLQARLRDLSAAGFRPEAVTALGFPRSTGVTGVSSVEINDGIPHHRLDLGPFYPLDGPPDRRLLDAAWLAAGIAKRVRPATIHALLDGDGIEAALLGAALAAHLRLPIVVEVVSDTASATGDAERMPAVVTRVIRRADRVITADAETRSRIVARGLDPAQVAVVPVGGDSGSDGEDLRAVYAGGAARAGARIRS